MEELSQEKLSQMLEEVSTYEVTLEEDPTLPHLGTRYLQKSIAQCRKFSNRVQHYLQLAMRYERSLLTEIKQVELDMEFKLKELLADDPIVRQQKALEDRKALAEMQLKTESENLKGLRIKLIDIQETVKILKFKYGDLQRTNNDIKIQRSLVKDDTNARLGGGEGFDKPQTNQDRTTGDGLKPPVTAEALGPADILDPSRRPEGLPEPLNEAHALQISEFLRRNPERKPAAHANPVLNGKLCAVCKAAQYDSPAGTFCDNGHGGAESIDPPTSPVTAVDYNDLLT